MPPPRWRWGLQYVPFGWVPRKHPWGAAPRCPACPAGVPISPEKWGERGPGASPLDPRFLWPLVPTRWVLRWLSLQGSRDYFLRDPKTDLGRIFEGKYAGKNFPERKFPKQAHPPKAFPLGGRCPSAHTGADEGAILYPTFPCRSRKRGLPPVAPTEVFLLPRWATRSPPHPSPSVTASPRGEASGSCNPTRKSVPNQGT